MPAMLREPGARRPMVPLVTLLCVAVFWFVGGLIDYPFDERFEPSLLWQPMGVAKLLVTILVLAGMTLLATVLLGRIRYDAGFGAAVAGLVGLRFRAGDTYDALHEHGSGIFLKLAVELFVLGLAALAMWQALHHLRERGAQRPWIKRLLELPTPAARLADRKAAADAPQQRLLALGAHVLISLVLVMLLAQSGQRAQTLWAVGLASFFGAYFTQGLIMPTRPALTFLVGPIICGLLGYLAAAVLSDPSDLIRGNPGGLLAPLARPMPLDWIGVGLPAALLAYVMRRTKQLHDIIAEQSELPETQPKA